MRSETEEALRLGERSYWIMSPSHTISRGVGLVTTATTTTQGSGPEVTSAGAQTSTRLSSPQLPWRKHMRLKLPRLKWTACM
ncbi:hypothetical protein EX30DRAFT_343333 [Ascodesmis nigricans]|uniref:Uncharacterized protein n=1 Tax=Ascodesmis nigricans TaxID=341454 RepID=A0A4S2MMD7_9PEZI|nr:hypothetical protein EX30DRAFT_343333 [Ascodesmis nigricans]